MKSFLTVLILIGVFSSCGEDNKSSSSNGVESTKQYASLASDPSNPILMHDNLSPALFELEMLKNNSYILYEIKRNALIPVLENRWQVRGTSVQFNKLGVASFLDYTFNGTKYKCIRFIDESLNSQVISLMDSFRVNRGNGYGLMFCR